MKLGMNTMALEPTSASYSINPYRQSVCMCIPLSLLGNGSIKLGRDNECAHKDRRVGRIVFLAVRVVLN
jgi:hypothetical protein